jgi:uncharacterized damage-inducible protein DinB
MLAARRIIIVNIAIAVSELNDDRLAPDLICENSRVFICIFVRCHEVTFMSTKSILLGQFTACFDKNGWFVATKNAINGVTAEQAAWKPEGADNSIHELINHLNYYNNAYLQRFKGVDYEYKAADNDATFDESEAGSWDAERTRFDVIMNEWREEIEKADESKFDEMAPPRNESKWKVVIANINVHGAHHGGQIVLLRKLQGSWDSGGGVS